VPGWLKIFTAAGHPGASLRVMQPGSITSGHPIEIIHRPAHQVTIGLSFRALTTEPDLMPRLLEAGNDLDPDLRHNVEIATSGMS
jgi:MOSC domain-containing protein YiiM